MLNQDGGAQTYRVLALGLILTLGGCSDASSGKHGDAGASAGAGASGSGGSPVTHDAGGGDASIANGDASMPHGDASIPSDDASIPSGDASIPSGDAGLPGGDGPTWSNDVHPALVASCGGCHADHAGTSGPPMPGRPGGPGEATGDAPGKFALDDAHAAYGNLKPYVSAGDADSSALYIKISQDMPSTGGQRMPPELRQWDDANIQLVRDWIAAGAIEN